jgi:GNAT superfamily N-acetyltransferase
VSDLSGIAIRRLGPGDERLLELLAEEDADFDLPDQGRRRTPLSPDAAAEYLRDPSVLHWIAEDGTTVAGFVQCHVERRRADDKYQLLLYEIGVRATYRRRGVGTALVQAVRDWMQQQGVRKAWVLAEDSAGADAFYAACGFARDDVKPIQMTLSL